MSAQIVLMVPLGELPTGGIPGLGAGQLPVFPAGGSPDHLPAPPGEGPDQGLPGGGTPGHLPSLPQPPADLASRIIVALHRPGQDWVVRTYPVGPSQGLPGQGGRPDQGLPGQGQRPDQGLPPYPGQGLPGQGQRPDQGLPGQPDQGFNPPPGVSPHR